MEGPTGSVHLRWGRRLPGHDASPGTLVQTLQLHAPPLATGGAGREARTGRRAGGGEEQCGRLATGHAPGNASAQRRMTHGGGARGLCPPRRLREVRREGPPGRTGSSGGELRAEGGGPEVRKAAVEDCASSS